MNKLKNPGDNGPKADGAWDNLKDVKFASEGSNNCKAKYNEKYINDFSRETLEEILKNPKSLNVVGAEYLDQYKPNSDSKAHNLAGKESLDHYILERLSSNDSENFINSQGFKNYANYITEIANHKWFKSADQQNKIYPEYITNPVFRDKRVKELILTTARPNRELREMNIQLEQNQKLYEQEIRNTTEKMMKRERINQRELDIIGDYLYSSKDFDSGIGKTFAEYLFSGIKPDYNLKASIPMLGAITNYFASQYSINDEVRKNSRFIISDSEFPKHGIGVSTQYGCVLATKYYTKLSLTTDKGINKARTFEEDNNDLYSLMMVSFHELTHDHQKNLAKKGDKSSSSMMYIMRAILNEGSGCYIFKEKDGSETQGNYYKVNHDNDEIEVEADEESWRQCREFLAKHQRDYSSDETQRKINQNRLLQCEKNEEEVKGRRSFAHKFTNDFKAVSAIRYDIETLKSTVKKKPELLKTYPQLADYVDPSGRLKLDIFTSSELASGTFANDSPREDTFGNEIGTYIINDNQEFARLAEYISGNGKSFNNTQINNLMLNLGNIIHHTVEKARRLDRVNFANYDETNALGKDIPVQKRKTDTMRQYLIQAYRSVLLLDTVKQLHPELSEEISHQELAHIDGNYYFELSRDKKKDAKTNEIHYELSKDRKLDIVFVKQAVEAYKKTNNPILLNIAGQLRNDYNLQ